MTDWWQMSLVFLLAVNPAAVAAGWWASAQLDRQGLVRAAIAGLAVAASMCAIALVLAEPALDFLDVESPTFQVGAGVVLGLSGAQAVWRGYPWLQPADTDPAWKAGVYPLALPLLATPAVLIALLFWGSHPDVPAMRPWSALTLPLVLGAVAPFAVGERYSGLAAAVARVLGALLCLAAVALIVDGVQTV
jgi:small neutral amino acid transporter SnatA (MarC family)